MEQNKKPNTLLNIRSLNNPNKRIGNTARDILRLPWVFNSWVEKIIIITMTFWSIYAIFKIFIVGCSLG